MSFLEASWKEREEQAYKAIFDNMDLNIYPLSTAVFEHLNAPKIDPRWLTYGVFQCPPTANRQSWSYVTSGMSNPYEDEPEEYSGLGIELVIETAAEAPWAVDVLQTLMAYNLLLSTGEMGDYATYDYGHLIPLKLSETIQAVVFAHPVSFPCHFSIQSGQVDLLQVVGITEKEHQVAQQLSSGELIQTLLKSPTGLITHAERASVV